MTEPAQTQAPGQNLTGIVISVLLRDGWHDVVPGSFAQIDAVEVTDASSQTLSLISGNCYQFTGTDGNSYCFPASRFYAVKTSSLVVATP